MKSNKISLFVSLLFISSLSFFIPCNTSAIEPQISAGHAHSVALKSNGTLWAWGRNESGQLGDGLSGFAVYREYPAQVGTDTDWVSIAAGKSHTAALKTDGTWWQWGGLTDKIETIPTKVGTDTNWSKIDAGFIFTIALKSDGTLWAWGVNGFGQLGDGTTNKKTSPIQIGTDNKWSSVSTGDSHTIALKSDGTLWAWGKNENAELGDGTTINKRSPVQIGSDTNWSKISAGNNFTIALKSNGTLWAWGSNSFGQLGDGTSGYVVREYPAQVGTDTDWVSIAAGDTHSLALKSDGTLWAWGSNLFIGTINISTTPIRVDVNNDWVSFDAGGSHHIALQSDGSLWAWGYNAYGEVGDGTTTIRDEPVEIFPASDFDSDGIPDTIDNCPNDYNPDQADYNNNGQGDVCDPPPTLITLSSFTANQSNKKVVLKWETGTELDNLGFNIRRSESIDSKYIQINKKLIKAKGSSTKGASYTFKDKKIEAGKTYWYKLEDIDSNTGNTQHGPVEVPVAAKKSKTKKN
ncbi:MAG: hypothetical protein HZA77_12930 [Candidatus Schekmanbacteria bacterium]|nr:hypothetical protein [Candidatus Schekmanbacteria bacterium]